MPLTKRLIEQVKRNIERFDGYMFQLSDEEFKNWRSQIATSKSDQKGLRRPPYAFNEYGALMISSILNSPKAIEISRKIIKIFVELRNQIAIGTTVSEMKEKILKIEAEQETIRSIIDTVELNQKIDSKIAGDKIIKMSQKLHRMTTLLNEFQNIHLIIKRPENLDSES